VEVVGAGDHQRVEPGGGQEGFQARYDLGAARQPRGGPGLALDRVEHGRDADAVEKGYVAQVLPPHHAATHEAVAERLHPASPPSRAT
jgi:hypothetical protein